MNMYRFPEARTGWSWRTGTAVQVCVATIDMGEGGRLWVDLAAPDTVTAFEAPTVPALARLSLAAGPHAGAWIRQVMTALGPGGSSTAPELAPPPLSPAWARLAVVLGVEQWCGYDLDELLLAIDEGLAWHDAGFPHRGAALLSMAGYTLADLYTCTRHNRLPAPAADLVRRAADILTTPTDSTDSGAGGGGEAATQGADPEVIQRLRAIRATTAGAIPAPGLDLDRVVSGWADEHQRALASTLGSHDPDTTTGPSLIVDPRLIPARTITWTGLENHHDTHTHTSTVTVRARLAPGCDPHSSQARCLHVVFLNTDTQQVLDRRPLRPDPDTADQLIATLTLPDQQRPVTVVIAGLQPADYRVTGSPAHDSRARMEQLLLSTWATHRLAAADAPPTAATDDFPEQAESEISLAPIAAAPAEDAELSTTIRRLTHPGALITGGTDHTVTAPLLAELLYGIDRDTIRDLADNLWEDQ